MSRPRRGFTLIELLVVVAIIALLVSILLPSLGRARQQAKATVCSTRLRAMGQASHYYVDDFGTFAPADPGAMLFPNCNNPDNWQDSSFDCRRAAVGASNTFAYNDPVIGWLVYYGLDIKPTIPDTGNPRQQNWELFPYGFALQSRLEPATLWEGFFCPGQNIRNTSDLSSPEIYDPSSRHHGQGPWFAYASGYMHNRLLRCGVPITGIYGGEGRPDPKPPTNNIRATGIDNAYGVPSVNLSHLGGSVNYFIQANRVEQLTNPADTVYMTDSLDYMTSGSTRIDGFGGAQGGNVSAGMPKGLNGPYGGTAVTLSGRHLGTGNVLYTDGHVSRDDQIPRNRRGDMIIAATFADFVEEDDLGSQYKLMPGWRMFK